MVYRWLIIMIGVVLLASSDAWAACEVQTGTAAYANGTNLGGDVCGATGGRKVEISTLGSGEDQTNNLLMTSGGAVRQTTVTMGAAATANGTTAAFTIPTGVKTFYGQVAGTGAVVQTQAIYGDVDNDAADGVLVCTLVLNGTTRDQASCRTDVLFAYFYVVTTATSGTSATGAVYVHY